MKLKTQYDIYLTFAPEKARVAKSVAKGLAQRGIHVYWDWLMDFGLFFHLRLLRRSDDADLILALWSQECGNSKRVVRETETAGLAGNLLLATLDGERPRGKLFFRYDCLELGPWRPGDHDHPRFMRLVNSIRRRSAG